MTPAAAPPLDFETWWKTHPDASGWVGRHVAELAWTAAQAASAEVQSYYAERMDALAEERLTRAEKAESALAESERRREAAEKELAETEDTFAMHLKELVKNGQAGSFGSIAKRAIARHTARAKEGT